MRTPALICTAAAALLLATAPILAGPGGNGNGGGNGASNGNGGNSASAGSSGSRGHGAETSAAARSKDTPGLAHALSVVETTPAAERAITSISTALERVLGRDNSDDD